MLYIKTSFTLMAYGEYQRTLARFVVAIQRKITAFATRDHQLTQTRLGGPADQRVIFEHCERRQDQVDSFLGSRGIAFNQKRLQPLQIG